MQFSEIKTRGWWAIEDDPTTPSEITDAEMGVLINQGLADLAGALNINKSATITLTSNVGTLPTDMYEPVRVEDANSRAISQIEDINDKGDYAQCWIINSSTSMTVYPVTTAVASVTMYYKAYPAALAEATSVPTDIPAEYHHYLADVWVKAHYALRRNFLDEYNGLMLVWDDVKNKIAYACNNRRGSTVTRTIRMVY